MHILHVIGATAAGGAERVAVDLACALARPGVRVDLFALAGTEDEVGADMRRRLAAAGVGFRAGPPGRVRLGALLAYRAAVRALSPDIVHLHTPNTELAHALLGPRAPLVARTVHSMRIELHEPYRWAFRRNRATRSIACSEAVAEANGAWASPMEVIPNGVVFSWPERTPEGMAAARRRLGLTGEGAQVLMVGSMRGESLADAPKAHDVMIRAWRRAGVGSAGARLHLVGDGNLRAELGALAGGDPSIRFHGVSAAVPDWLQAADLFAMPSRYEGLPMAGIEALGTGLPCVFSDIPPLRELAPDAVLWALPGEVESLAAALHEAVTPAFTRRQQDAARYRRDNGMERMVESYLQYYRALLGGRPLRAAA